MVGMSTVQEARVANELSLACCAVSCVSNFAAGVTNEEIDHADVVEAGRKIGPALIALLGRRAEADRRRTNHPEDRCR